MDFEELICGVCEQHFDSDQHLPRMVPKCGHTFCTQCIADIIYTTSTPSEAIFCCPGDRIVIRSKDLDVASFPINYLLASLVDKKANLMNNTIPRSATKEEYSLNESRRPHLSHGHSTAGSQRNVDGDVSLYSTNNNFLANDNASANHCGEHGKVLEIVCVDDKCRICSSCALFGSHRNHEIRPEGDVMKEVANRAENIIDLFQVIQKQEKGIAEDYNANHPERTLNEKQNDLTQLIHKKFQEYVCMLQEQEKLLLERLDEKFKQLKENIIATNQVPEDLAERVKRWKSRAEEALTIMSEKSEKGDIAFELLEDRRNTKNDIVILGEKLTSELKKAREMTSKPFEDEEINISVTFNDNFSKILDLLCQVKTPKGLEQKSASVANSEDLIERSAFQNLPAFGKIEKNSFRNYTKGLLPEINLFKRTEGSDENKNKENVIYPHDPRLLSPNANFGSSLDHRRSEHDTDLLNFELNDLNIAELAESDHIARFAPSELQEPRDVEQDRLRSFRRNEIEDYEGSEALNNLTNRSISSRSVTERKSKQPGSRKGEDAYISLSRDNSRVPRRSVSPMKRENSSERMPKSSRSRRNKDLQVSEKYEPVVDGIVYNIVDSADLTGADLGDIGVSKLAEYLRSNTKLRSLKLLRNKITDEGGIALANALLHNRTLQTLNLTQNLLTERTVDAFLELTKTHKSLKTIYFNQNSVSLRNVKNKIKEMGTMGVSVNI